MRRGKLVLAVGVGALVAAGCGSSSSSNQGQTVSLSRAADVSSSAPGYKSDVRLRETIPGEGTVNATATGTFSPASRLGALTMNINAGSAGASGPIQLQMVLDRTTFYMKLPPQLSSQLPTSKPWLYLNLNQAAKAAGIPGLGSLVNSSSSLSDPGQYLSFLHATADGTVKNLGQATINGRRTTHYSAEVDLAKLPKVVPASARSSVQQLVSALEKKGATTRLPIQTWIDSSNLIRRIQLAFSEPTGTGQSVGISLTEDFVKYGPQPAPTVPSPDQSTNILSLVTPGG